MSLNVGNCPRCGKVYMKNQKNLCPACVREIDDHLEACIKYLKNNKGTTLKILSEETGVSLGQITKFIKEGRILLASLPNLAYECDMCGAEIREGTMCASCRQKLAKEISNSKEDDIRREALKKQENHVGFNIGNRLKDRMK